MNYLQVPNEKPDWVLNTPERKEILKEGAPKHANLNLIGKGAFGSVFKAIFQGRAVALKIVKNSNGINRTENEANILGWKHRNIVKVLMIESTPKYGLIIMEHFPSQSLQQILDAIELSLAHRAFITLDILNGLGYCHKQNLLHLDIKPQNVLIAFKSEKPAQVKHLKPTEKFTKNYNCKLCDFGSSLKLEGQKISSMYGGGTIRYMSPEALRGIQLTYAADIFSLGILMWQLQQRRLPYDIIRCNEIIAFQVVKHNLRPNSDLSDFLLSNSVIASPTPQFQKCVCQCLSLESRRRSRQYNTILNDSKTTPFKCGCYSAAKPKSLTLSISPNPRNGKSIQILHSTALKNVARNLNQDLDFANAEKNSNDKIFELDSIFNKHFNWNNEHLKTKEKIYKETYELCWQAKPEKRPKFKELKLNLQNILQLVY